MGCHAFQEIASVPGFASVGESKTLLAKRTIVSCNSLFHNTAVGRDICGLTPDAQIVLDAVAAQTTGYILIFVPSILHQRDMGGLDDVHSDNDTEVHTGPLAAARLHFSLSHLQKTQLCRIRNRRNPPCLGLDSSTIRRNLPLTLNFSCH